ncbi:hypothetical protein M3Y99_00524300 [Aphelenchoides fujianensis]|nr:hypothetical protein M3Y99_00524300 [Aphelenchoides fujianensis]
MPLGESDPGKSLLFEQGAKYGTSRVVFLEDLVDADDVRPQIELQQASTKETIEAEMKLIRSRFQILIDACRKVDIYLTSYPLLRLLDRGGQGGRQEEVGGIESIDFEQLGDGIFGPDSTNPKADHVDWKFLLDGTSTMLCFHFVHNQDYLDIPVGRSTWTKTFPHDIA